MSSWRVVPPRDSASVALAFQTQPRDDIITTTKPRSLSNVLLVRSMLCVHRNLEKEETRFREPLLLHAV